MPTFALASLFFCILQWGLPSCYSAGLTATDAPIANHICELSEAQLKTQTGIAGVYVKRLEIRIYLRDTLFELVKPANLTALSHNIQSQFPDDWSVEETRILFCTSGDLRRRWAGSEIIFKWSYSDGLEDLRNSFVETDCSLR